MSIRSTFWAVTSTILLSGCAAKDSTVRVNQAGDVPTQCRTFGWQAVPDAAASFADQWVRNEALETMREKGYAVADETADCRLAYQFASRERLAPSGPSIGIGAGGGSGNVGGGIGLSLPIGKKSSQPGTFSIQVIDVRQKAEVWSGEMDSTFATAELSEDEAKRVVRQVLAGYPDSGK